MTFYYIEVSADHSPTGHFSRESAVEGYNTATDSATNGKPYLVPATYSEPSPTQCQVKSGPVYDVGAATITYAVDYKPLADCKAVKLAQLAAYRYEQETGGITITGVSVKTDRESQSLITAARIIAKEDANYSVNWKAGTGFVTLNASTIIAIADAVRAHVQACFDNEKNHTDAINALSTAAAVASYDITTGW